MRGMERNRVANSVILLREKWIVCLTLELQQIEFVLMHNLNSLYVTHSNCSRSNIVISHTPVHM